MESAWMSARHAQEREGCCQCCQGWGCLLLFPINSAWMIHHSLGLSIWSAHCLWQGAHCVRIMYGRNVIGWSAAAFWTLCPYDERGGDDHRSHFIVTATFGPCYIGIRLYVVYFYDTVAFPFMHFWFCWFSHWRFCVVRFLWSVLSFCMCPVLK